ncbi:protein L [Pseudomonas sp. G1002]|uniref:protein L n=1 Tax=Pseudomonas sp. G1002 TaxID=410942 RepID=UPI0015A033DA|nr:protein L [Pseudomonas sp. G1002]NWC06584.1 protein L [Pseudomonas sp. G1002]
MAEIIANTAHHIKQTAPTILDAADEWKYVFGIGSPVPASGIYRCTGCGDEITSNKGDKFPPQNRHQHADPKVEVKWQLIVKTTTKA